MVTFLKRRMETFAFPPPRNDEMGYLRLLSHGADLGVELEKCPSAHCLLSLHSRSSRLDSTEILNLLSQPFYRVKFILKLCFKGISSFYLINPWIQMRVLILKYYLGWRIKGFWGLFLFFHLHLIGHYGLHFAKSLCKLRKEEKKKVM